MIFPLGSHVSKRTQGASSSILLKPVPVGGRVSHWSHLFHFHKGFESGRKGQGRTTELTLEKIPHSKKCKYSAYWQCSSEVSVTVQNHLNTVKVLHAWRAAVRGQARGSVPGGVTAGRPWLGGASLQSKLPVRDVPLALLTGRHGCPVLCGELVMEEHFCLDRRMSPWCKLVTFIAAMSNEQQRSSKALQHQLCSEHC